MVKHTDLVVRIFRREILFKKIDFDTLKIFISKCLWESVKIHWKWETLTDSNLECNFLLSWFMILGQEMVQR